MEKISDLGIHIVTNFMKIRELKDKHEQETQEAQVYISVSPLNLVHIKISLAFN